ncbi:phage tail protein [Erythrobacter sp. SDW2]|uniref:phage tail protein n=1 Tax=Erythrobacter sp. SDW2 TaxID=2907154 RepID=UPI001F2AFB60|nr:phage tail protein [Erythrobacter sp. SDW2]UIP07838.1 phage tail protein [Erythrobacter sp. SDW2]
MSFLPLFRFRVDFHATTLDDPSSGAAQPVCSGQFSEVSGFEASMEPFTITEGGRNWGEIHRVGPTNFATLVLKRGMTADHGLWTWFHGVASGSYAYRLNATVVMLGADEDIGGAGTMAWEFANCLPIKLKGADLSSSSSEIGIEELHLNHEGMQLVPGGAA